MNCPTCRSSQVLNVGDDAVHLCRTCKANFVYRNGRAVEITELPDLQHVIAATETALSNACDARDTQASELEKELDRRRESIKLIDAQITELTRRRRALKEKAERAAG